MGNARNSHSKINCNETITNYPCLIKTTPRANITFSDSNNTSLNPAEDLGNLPAEPTQSQITAKLSDPKLSGDLFNSVNLPSTGKEGQVTTVVTKACHKMTENPVHKNIKHSTGHCTSNTVIKIILDNGSNGDLLFHEKGMEKHFPYLTRQVSKSWHMSNGNFLTKGISKVSLKFFEYSNSKEYLVTPDVVEYDRKKMTKSVFDLILGCQTMKELGIVLDF